MSRILLGHLGNNGDCLYATIIARQIKSDFPGCHLTWAISSKCKPVILNNPYVDEICEIPLAAGEQPHTAWGAFERDSRLRLMRGEFEHAFFTQVSPNHFANYDGTVRPSILRNYPRPITVPIETVICLTDQEREQVERFVKAHQLDRFPKLVIFECATSSGQSFMTPELAVEVARRVTMENPEACFVFATHTEIPERGAQLVEGRALSLRETALLTHHAALFVGCGSGVTVAATSEPARQALPNIQILDPATSVYASFRHDFEYFGKAAGHFLEATTDSPARLAEIIKAVLEDGVTAAKARFDTRIPVEFSWYLRLVESELLCKGRYVEATQSLTITAGRYGWTPQLRRFARAFVLPFLDQDPTSRYAHHHAALERFREACAGRVVARLS